MHVCANASRSVNLALELVEVIVFTVVPSVFYINREQRLHQQERYHAKMRTLRLKYRNR